MFLIASVWFFNNIYIFRQDPFEWEKDKKKAGDGDQQEKSRIKKADERREKEEGGPDTDTVKDIPDSVLTETIEEESQTKGLAKEDTLDNVDEMNKRDDDKK